MRALSAARSGARNSPAPGLGGEGGGLARAVEGGERPAGRDDDLERAQRALAVAGLRRAAVSGSRAASRACSAGVGSPSASARTSALTASGTAGMSERPLGERAEIETGAADEDQRRAALRFGEDLARALKPAADRKILRAVDLAEQEVSRAPLLFDGRPRRQDSKVAVDLHRVGVDDRRAEWLGESERDRRLAARRRAGDEQRAFHRSLRQTSTAAPMPSTRFPVPYPRGRGEGWNERRGDEPQRRRQSPSPLHVRFGANL